MGTNLGLKALHSAVDNHFEKLPDAAFRLQTYIPKELETKQQREERKERRRQRRRSRNNVDGAEAAAAGGAAGGTAGDIGRESDDGRDDNRQNSRHRSESQDQFSNSQVQYPNPQDYNPRNGYQQDTQYPQQASLSQGDPNFPYDKGDYQESQQRSKSVNSASYQTYKPPDYNLARAHEQTYTPPQMGDQYYAPPPPGGGFHTYDPQESSDYRQQDAPSSRYTPSRYQPEGYQNQAAITGGRGSDRYDRYSDDEDDRRGDRRDNRDRKGKSSHKSSKQHRSSSGSSVDGNPVRKALHGRFDKTEDGLTASAIGAVVGGVVGNKFFKGPISTVAGIVIGGVGANAWEAHEQKQKEKKNRDGRDRRSHRTRSEGRNSGYYSDYDEKSRARYDSEDSEPEYTRGKPEKRASSSRRGGSRRDDPDEYSDRQSYR